MNPYKAAWYANTLLSDTTRPPKEFERRQKSKFSRDKGVQAAKSQMRQEAILSGAYAASRYAAKSQLTGNLGVALRVGGRVGLRVIPVVGMALLAYDVYQFGKWVMED